jgi:hypothetical protein
LGFGYRGNGTMSVSSEDPSGESALTAIFRLVRMIIVIDVILFAVTGLVCYFVGWRTLRGLSDGLLIAGLLVAGLAYLTSGTNLRNGHTRRDVKYLAYKTLLETGAPPALSYPVVFAGFIAILASILLGLFS